MTASRRLLYVGLCVLAGLGALAVRRGRAQPPVDPSASAAMERDMADMEHVEHMEHASAESMRHMRLTPTRAATHADSARMRAVEDTLRRVLARYADPAAAEADGYHLFLPEVKHQRVYHYTNWRRAFKEAFRFDPAQPTSILYRDGAGGRKELVGAMYSAPARTPLSKLDARVPLSVARWHEHVNWCVPRKRDAARWAERRDGKPLFGPESPVDTRATCDSSGGVFHDRVFGWMVHVNVAH